MNTQNKTAVRIAIDIETLSRRTNGVILSIGLVAFTRFGPISTHYSVLDQNVQLMRGRHVEPATVAWWDKQAPEAKAVLSESLGPLAMHPAGVVTMIKSFVSMFENDTSYVEGVYGYGSDFDNAMIIDMCREFSGKDPWDYRLNRCGRTVLAMYPEAKAPKVGTHHNALDDAIWLANSLTEAFNRSAMIAAYGAMPC